VSVPSDLPAALLRRAATHPEEPWLFRPEGWDWVWHPWKEVAGWVDAWAARLVDRPWGSRASYFYDSRPETVALDLAIQAAGLFALPVGAGEPAEIAPFEPSLPGLLFQGERRKAGGVIVQTGEWTAEEIVAEASGMAESIGESGKREIVVLGGLLTEPLERTMLAWATLTGAAVVLDPNPATRAATAAWVRPTVFHGTAAEITHLRSRLAKRPFRRLRTLIVDGGLPAEDEAFWAELGVRVHFAAKRRNRGI
jgi:hypothetical protein